MKKFLITTMGVFFLIAMNGCKKDQLPKGYDPFGSQGGVEIVNHEKYINDNRGDLSYPAACDIIATLGRDEVITVFHDEMIKELDGFTTRATQMYRDEDNYDKWYRKDLTRSRLIRKLGDEKIIDYDVRRVLSYYSRAMKDKAIEYVIDGICFGGGVRDQWTDNSFQNMFSDTIASYIDHESWKVLYSDEIYYYYFYYAVDPSNYAKAKKMGTSVPTIEEMQQMFPREEIMKQKNLEVYRKETLKQYDFTNADWKSTGADVSTK